MKDSNSNHSRGRVTRRLLRLGIILLLSGAASLALPAGPAAAQAGLGVNQLVVVDEIRIVGNTDLSDTVLKAALDIPVGRPLSREALDDHVQSGKQRLEGLGYFRLIDLALTKGQARGHFVIVLTVEAERSSYFGVTAVRNDLKTENYGGPIKQRQDTYQAYGGSRNLFGTGLRGELTMLYYQTSSHSTTLAMEQSMPGASISLYDPALFDSSWFAGASLAYFTSKSTVEFDIPELPTGYVKTNSKGYFSMGYGVIGKRFGLATTSIGLSRFLSRFQTESTSEGSTAVTYSDPATSIFGRFSYSNKTYLTKVEPGYSLSLDYSRPSAPDYEAPSFDATVLQTWMFAGQHALTPVVAGRYEYTSTANDRVVPQRSYDFSLKYDYVATRNLSFEIGYGEYRIVDLDTVDDQGNYPSRRKKVAVFYTDSGLILSLAFQYGAAGLDPDQDQLFLSNVDRFTQ